MISISETRRARKALLARTNFLAFGGHVEIIPFLPSHYVGKDAQVFEIDPFEAVFDHGDEHGVSVYY